MKKFLKLLTIVACLCALMLTTACKPRTLGWSCEKLAKRGYEIEIYKAEKEETSKDLGFEIDGDVYIAEGWKESALTERYILIFAFEKASDAKEMYKEYKHDVKKLLDEEGVIDRSGKVVIIADMSAYEDYKD